MRIKPVWAAALISLAIGIGCALLDVAFRYLRPSTKKKVAPGSGVGSADAAEQGNGGVGSMPAAATPGTPKGRIKKFRLPPLDGGGDSADASQADASRAGSPATAPAAPTEISGRKPSATLDAVPLPPVGSHAAAEAGEDDAPAPAPAPTDAGASEQDGGADKEGQGGSSDAGGDDTGDDAGTNSLTEEEISALEDVEQTFMPLLILSAVSVAFAHGANDLGNAVGEQACSPSSALSTLFNIRAERCPAQASTAPLRDGLRARLRHAVY